MFENSLAKRHPNLFLYLLAIVFANFMLAYFLNTGSPQQLINFAKLPEKGIIPPLWFWGDIFGVAGVLILVGALSKYYRFARWGLIISAGIGFFWGYGFIINFLTGDIRGITAPVMWPFYVMMCIITSREPTANPLSAALQNDIRSTITQHTNQVKRNGS